MRRPGSKETPVRRAMSSSTAVTQNFSTIGGTRLQVTAGHVDVFAVSLVEGKAAGARHHLFRVESGEIILDLQDGFDQVRRANPGLRGRKPRHRSAACAADRHCSRSIRWPRGSGSSRD